MRSVSRNRGGWTSVSLAYVERVQQVLDELHDYLPLTLRQLYYQLVAAGFIANEHREYAKLSRLLTRARIDGIVPWTAIEDRARATLQSGGWSCSTDFVQDELERFLTGYRRDLLQSQDIALELWVEKDALSRICHAAAFSYCVPVVVAKGFSSVSYVHDCRQRVEANAEQGQRTVLLYFGDLDPSGWEMLPSMLTTLQAEMGLGEWVEGRRCALLPQQVEDLGLPRNPDALKRTDSRAAKYIERFSALAVELDAVPPATLERMVREAIEAELDLSTFDEERRIEHAEGASVAALRERVRTLVESALEGSGE